MAKSKNVNSTKFRSDFIPARYILSFLIFYAVLLMYAQKLCLSIAIVAMVNQTAVNTPNITKENNACPVNQPEDMPLLSSSGEYLWSSATQGVILGAYFYGYVCSQAITGRLAEIFGGKWLLGTSIFLGSLLTLMTPVAADLGAVALTVVRVATGFSHGICIPAMFTMFAVWAPVKERSSLLAIGSLGSHVGTLLSMPLTGYLSEHGFAGGWPSAFYLLGISGCIWFVSWCVLAYSKPSDHPRISKEELEYIQQNQYQEHEKLPVPWKSILTSIPVLSVAITLFTNGWCQTTLLTKIPTYLEAVLHVPIEQNGIINCLIQVCCCVSLLASGYLSDRLRFQKRLSFTTVRKMFEIAALGGTAVCVALLPSAGCDILATVALLSTAMAMNGLYGGGHVPIVIDMAPQYAGTIFGLMNAVGNISGVLSPVAAGLIMDEGHGNISQWSVVFYICAGSSLFGATIFTMGASAEQQEWAISRTATKEELTDGKHLLASRKELEASFKYGTIS